MSEEESFKVTDRRGHSKDVDHGEPSAGASPGSYPSEGDSPRVKAAGEPASSAGPGPGAPDLQGIFVMFASSALINLGEAADPATGGKHVDLDQAREAVDVLLLLRDKTHGNRTEEESRLLEEILYDLQMRFVRAAQGRQPR